MKLVHLHAVPPTAVSHNADIAKRLLLAGSDLPGGVQLAEAVFPPGSSAPAHAHAGLTEVFFFTHGEGSVRIGRESHAVRTGSCLKVDTGELHEISNTGNEPLHVVYFALPSDNGHG